MAKRLIVPQAVLRQLLDYDPDTGVLLWKPRGPEWFLGRSMPADVGSKKWNTRHAGKPALNSCDGPQGLRGSILGRTVSAHRVIWEMVYGDVAGGHIDHINGVPTDNRLCNLRLVSRVMNMRNKKRYAINKSGVSGVNKCGDRWRVLIGAGGKQVHCGYFTSFEDAVAARKAAEAKMAYHQNHGRE